MSYRRNESHCLTGNRERYYSLMPNQEFGANSPPKLRRLDRPPQFQKGGFAPILTGSAAGPRPKNS